MRPLLALATFLILSMRSATQHITLFSSSLATAVPLHRASSSGGSYSPPPSSGSGSYSQPSSSSPSYTPPSSSSNSGSSSNSSRSSDSGSRSSSSSSSDRGSSPSRSSSPEPSSRNSSSGSSSSPNVRSGAANNTSGTAGSNIHNSRNNSVPAHREGMRDANSSTASPSGNTRGNMDGLNLREAAGADGRMSSTSESRCTCGVEQPCVSKRKTKYANKELNLLEKQSKWDRESAKLYTKYKLAGNVGEFTRRKAKLDEKRAKLINDQRKLASDYRLEADRKRCKGKECFAMCPTGTVPAHRGCVAGPAPNPNPPLNSSQDCTSGFRWDGRQCVQEASTATQYGVNCNEYYLRLMEQKKILQTLRSSAHLACAADSASQDCGDFTQPGIGPFNPPTVGVSALLALSLSEAEGSRNEAPPLCTHKASKP